VGRNKWVRVAFSMCAVALLLSGCVKPRPGDDLRLIGAIPPNSGSGERIVYRRGTQQVWVVNGAGFQIDTFRSSGNLSLPRAGTYFVNQKQPMGWDNSHTLRLPYFIVFNGDIGFHGYPLSIYGVPIQNDAQLGQPLSHGCVRLADAKIQFLWNWTHIGTKVVVL